MFSNREISTAIWALIVFAFLLSKPQVRASIGQLLLHLIQWKIVLCLAFMVVYVSVIVLILRSFGVWTVDQLKDSVLWLCFVGFPLLLTYLPDRGKTPVAKSIVRDNLRAVLIFEFIVNTYALPLAGELILVPALTVLVAVSTYAAASNEHQPVAQFLGVGIAFTAVALVSYACWMASSDYQHFATRTTLRNFALAPILSIAFIPFLYAALIAGLYDEIFVFLRMEPEKSPDLRRYARIRLIRHFGLNLKKLRRFRQSRAFELRGARSREDVDHLLMEGGKALAV